MPEAANKNLLQNRKVLDEINRHQWIESEKAGHDIGFEKASEDWLTRFSKAWMDYHLPNQKNSSRQKSKTEKGQKAKRSTSRATKASNSRKKKASGSK